MHRTWKQLVVVVALTATIQQASAQSAAAVRKPVLLGTTGACNNLVPGGPCTQTSRLVQIDLQTGAPVKGIGPVGFTVNGLAWDRTSRKLYASTAVGDVTFHGLITIDPAAGAGTPSTPAFTTSGSPARARPSTPSPSIPSWGRCRAGTTMQVDPQLGNVTQMAQTLPNLHVLAFVKD